MTKSQALYGKGRFDGKIQGIIAGLFIGALVIGYFIFRKQHKQQTIA